MRHCETEIFIPRSVSDPCYLMRLWCVIWCTSNVYFPIPWWGHLPIPQGAPGRQERGGRRRPVSHSWKNLFRNYCYFFLENLYIINLFSHNLKKKLDILFFEKLLKLAKQQFWYLLFGKNICVTISEIGNQVLIEIDAIVWHQKSNNCIFARCIKSVLFELQLRIRQNKYKSQFG